MNGLWQDLRYGARMLWKRPAFTLVAVTALALGIGANTAIFSIVNGVLLRQLPYHDPERLVMLWETDTKRGGAQTGFSYPRFTFLREQQKDFEAIAAYTTRSFNVVGPDGPVRVQGAHISEDFFRATGVAPRLGRAFSPEETQAGAPPVVILGHELWQNRFGGNPDLVGQSVTSDGRAYSVVGVMPAGFKLFDETIDLWVPRVNETNFLNPQQIQRGATYLAVIGRLKPGVGLEQANAALGVISRQYQQAFPGNSDAPNGMGAGSLQEYLVGNIRPTLLLLSGAVACVLLIACLNVANLLLARVTARHKEIAVRVTLGATFWRLVRQTLTESVLLSVLGGALGLLLAYWGLRFLLGISPDVIPRADAVTLDGRVLGFTLLVSALTGLLFGVAPALLQARTDPNESLKEGGRGGSAGARSHRLHSALVVLEVALSLVLLIGAGLLLRGFVRLRNVETGLDPRGVLTMQVALSSTRYATPPQQAVFYDQVLQRVKSLPGVTAAGATTRLHLDEAGGGVLFFPEGQPDLGPENPQARLRVVSPQYFQALSIPLVRGRPFDERDNAAGQRVMLINESMARKYFPGQDPLGKRITYTLDRITCEVVGVVRDVKTSVTEAQAREEIYVPYAQRSVPNMTLVVRGASADPAGLARDVRREVQAVDAEQPVANLRTMEQVISASVVQPRFTATLLLVFAGVALVLASIGIYGVMSYSVTERTREFGILMAVGAQPRDVLRMVLGQGLKLAAVGVVIGLLATVPLTRVLISQLYGMSAADPVTFAGVSLLLLAVALLACYVPALRATKVDPIIALRHE
ncbi:MAG: ABC transporter permease [Acidobacteria bacterium]|nr:ABC transporter permease [Acidobacteriota bacterium]